MENIYRSEVWLVDLNPPWQGKEIHGERPALVISVDEINNCPADLVIILPITTTDRKIPSHIKVAPPEGGLRKASFIKCDQIRTISKNRFIKKLGTVSDGVLVQIEEVLRTILSL